MKFGFASTPVGPRGHSDEQLYRDAIEDARLGHALGYDSAWALEHHFTPYFPQPDLSVYLSHVAAHCPGLGLGTCVIVLPWHHPLRLAEQIAMLSLLSTGDLYLGIGRGTARYEFDRLGVDMTQTRSIFEEMLTILRKGLAGEPFSFSGKHYQFPETQVRPRANLARIHLFGAIGSPESAGVMGDLGLPLIHTSSFPDDMAQGFVRTWQARRGASAADVAAAESRQEEFGFAWCMYVIGSPQVLHMRQLKAVLGKLGYPWAPAQCTAAMRMSGPAMSSKSAALELFKPYAKFVLAIDCRDAGWFNFRRN